MDQHPVPQNISSYEFRLVGDMTLKQFFQLAGGILFAVILYHTNLPFIIKWPLIIIGVLVGIMLAFVPVGGRPFSQWLMAFIKAIYAPTQYLWNPNFQIAQSPVATTATSLPTKSTPLDKFEQQLFDRFTNIFKGQPVTIATNPVVPVGMNIPVATTTPTPVPVAPTPASMPKHETIMSTMTQTAQPQTAPAPVQVPVSAQSQTVSSDASTTPAPLTADVPVTVNFTPRPTIVRTPEQAKLARFATNMPEPGQANIIVGQISDTTNSPMDGVIIEIAESATDIPVRALRTNRLGQFQIATPLTAGNYTLHFEKDGFSFESVSVPAEGKIIAPILVVGKAGT